jgi:MFS family permease
LGYISGMVLSSVLRGIMGWRGVFYITGSLGVLVAALVFFGVREMPRGKAEPELADLEQIGMYRFDWRVARELLSKHSLRLLFAQGFFGVFPWQVITYWFFNYLETERGYSSDAATTTMAVAVLVLAAGYFAGGVVGDVFFKRTPRGRLIVATVAVLLGAILLIPTLLVPTENQTLFLIMLSLTALFIPFAAPNVTSTVCDVTLPEVRSTALAIQYFVESGGAALAPLLAGVIADRSSLQNAILLICVSTWVVCATLFAWTAYLVPRDIETLRLAMRERAERERQAAN